FQQGAHIAQTALLSKQRGDIQDPLCGNKAGAWSIPSVIRAQLHGSALSRVQSVKLAGKVRGDVREIMHWVSCMSMVVWANACQVCSGPCRGKYGRVSVPQTSLIQ